MTNPRRGGPVEGRWRIYKRYRHEDIEGPATLPIDVVPCEGQAVERAAMDLHAAMRWAMESCSFPWDEEPDESRELWRERARVALRGAGRIDA